MTVKTGATKKDMKDVIVIISSHLHSTHQFASTK